MSIYFKIYAVLCLFSLFFSGLKSAWIIVFTCRMWWAWIQHKNFMSTTASTTTKRNSISKPFYYKNSILVSGNERS